MSPIRKHPSEEQQLSDRLRALRLERQLSLAALASKTGLTKGFLSQIERGAKIPSISTLLKVAQALGVAVGTLFEGSARIDVPYSLVRRRERKRFAREGSLHGYNYESIAFRKKTKKMEPFVMVPPRSAPRTLFDHDGDEMIYVLSGRLELRLGNETIVLRPGDCIYFDASIGHHSRSMGRRAAQALVVVSSLGAS
ncbi:MAG: helix-turn-helix transcriptional regulator [Candidatus Rokubacteria bacterium]|nr:helix-turn-helix transcriptional regulator [Candidatus Rokubacteria bacterium]